MKERLGMVACPCTSSTWKVEIGGLQSQALLVLMIIIFNDNIFKACIIKGTIH